jgi:GTP:adenosylcobinamide-phosphate guanylyltransferase/aminoglycoside phosphotransferase
MTLCSGTYRETVSSMEMKVKYIIVQAGGRGTRLGRLTANKPKALVPVNNLPVLFHLFHKFPDKNFIIIGDYKYKILEKYLESFADVRYLTVHAYQNGNCAGIHEALQYIPAGKAFMLIWSDLILAPDIEIDELGKENHIGISRDFECRWSFINGIFEESLSQENGVAGMFIFTDKVQLSRMPKSGEFVKFLQNGGIKFKAVNLLGTKEIGTISGIENAQAQNGPRCRSFNRIEETKDKITKIPLGDLGKKLAVREIAWYKEAQKYAFGQIPEIISFEPLAMRRIKGQDIFRANMDDVQKKKTINSIVDSLYKLHSFGEMDIDYFSLNDAYYAKTIQRIDSVRNLIPFANQKEIIVNNIKCRNIYFYKDEFHTMTQKLFCINKFTFIHGDCTFSNTMIDNEGKIIFIDPRGYFGFTELYGDAAYDWAKVYYSINGDYDQFNNGNFILDISEDSVFLDIASGNWHHLSEYFLGRIKDYPVENIRIIHALIWLSLTAYVWEDFDSVCGAFYKGILLLNELWEDK